MKKPPVFKIHGYSRYEDETPSSSTEVLDQEVLLEVVHDKDDAYSQELQEQLEGIDSARIIQLEPIEGGGPGGAELVTYIFDGFQISVNLIAGGFLAELGAMGVRKLIKVLAKKKEVGKLSVGNSAETGGYFELEVILPKNLTEKEAENVLHLVDSFLSKHPNAKVKMIYERSGKILEDFSPPGWEATQ